MLLLKRGEKPFSLRVRDFGDVLLLSNHQKISPKGSVFLFKCRDPSLGFHLLINYSINSTNLQTQNRTGQQYKSIYLYIYNIYNIYNIFYIYFYIQYKSIYLKLKNPT